jgi:tetratricopeptide (TPR) repeat protein
LLLCLAVFSAGCQGDEERVQNFLERGKGYVTEGQNEEAIIEYKNVLQIDPENPEAHEALSLAYLQLNKPREAYWEMSETVRVSPENTEAKLRYGTISAAIGDYDLSLEQAEDVLAIDSNNARAYTLRAQARETREDLDGAEADFNAAILAEPDSAAFHFLLGGFLERQKRSDDAEEAYRKLLEVEPSFLAASAVARLVMRDDTRGEELDAVIEEVIALALQAPVEPLVPDPGTEEQGTVSLLHNVLREAAIVGAYTLKGLVAFQRNEFDAAIAALEEGVGKSEGKIELIYQMANLYRVQGLIEEENAMILRATQEVPDNAAAQLVLSTYRGQQGDFEGALAAARAARQAEPDNKTAQLREAELLVDVGVRDQSAEAISEGREIVDAILKGQPESPEANFVKAKIGLAKNDLDAAKVSLETTLQARPNWAEARFILGSTLAASGELSRARVELESAVENNPKLAEASKLLTQIYSQLGEHEFAIEVGRAYLVGRPEDTEIRIVVGQSLIRLGQAQAAYEEIGMIPEESRGAAALFALGRLDLAFGRSAEGAAKLGRAEELAPGNPQVLRSLLAIDRSKDDLAASVTRINRALEVNPEDSEIIELDAEVKLMTGDAAGSRERLLQAVEFEPRNVTAQLALADLALRAGDKFEMVAIIKRASAAVPESSDLQFRLAQAYERNNQQADAAVAYERAISLNADLAMAKNNLAYLLAESGSDLDRALELAQQAKEQLPDDANAADTLGFVLLKRGLPSAAIGYLQEAAERFPDDSLGVQGIVRNHLAEAYEANNDDGKAKAESLKVLGLYETLSKNAAEQKDEFGEPSWAQESRERITRLDSAAL